MTHAMNHDVASGLWTFEVSYQCFDVA